MRNFIDFNIDRGFMMALRGIQPQLVEKRLKCLMYGVGGSGKTMAAISFPKPYLIDCEKGSDHKPHMDKLIETGGQVFHSSDFDEVLNEIKELATTPHEFKTLIIDPLTVIYDNLLDKSAADRASPSNPDGLAHGGHYIATNRKMKYLMRCLLALDMNVIITSHSKNEYGHNMVVLGSTFDCYRKLDYLFDLVFEIQKKGKFREAVVKKSRIATFPDGDRFSFSYEEVANRYGREILEKDAVAIECCTIDQISEFLRLQIVLKIKNEWCEERLKKAGVELWEDMPKETMTKIIDFLTQQETKQNETV